MSPPARSRTGDVRVVRLTGPPSEQRRRLDEARLAAGSDPVVAVTDRDTRKHLLALLARGADGVVLLEEEDRALTAVVAAVAAGQRCLPARATEALVARPLSARQRQVLALVVMGQTNGEIAARLHLGEATVKTHVAAALDKIGARSRAEAIDLVNDPAGMLATGVVGLSERGAAVAGAPGTD